MNRNMVCPTALTLPIRASTQASWAPKGLTLTLWMMKMSSKMLSKLQLSLSQLVTQPMGQPPQATLMEGPPLPTPVTGHQQTAAGSHMSTSQVCNILLSKHVVCKGVPKSVACVLACAH